VASIQRNQQRISVAKGDVEVPSKLVEDVFAPGLALRLGHHILYLMQVRSASMHRPRLGAQNQRIQRKRALGAGVRRSAWVECA
jgi:hypothetical protein